MAGPGLEDAGRHATEGRLAESHRDREVAEEPRRRRHPEGIRESLLQDDAEGPGSVSCRVVPAESTTYPELFRIRTFPRLASSVVLARTANALMQLALVLFVLQRFHSPTLAGVTVFLAIAPGIAVSPIAGALLDRHGRVRLIIVDYAVGALSLFLIAGLDAAGPLTRAVSTSVLADARDGLLYVVVRNASLRGLAIVVSFVNVGFGILIVALPVMIFQRISGDAGLVGELWALLGLGSALSVFF